MAQNNNSSNKNKPVMGPHARGMGGEKAKDFKGGIVRLLKYLKPFIGSIIFCVLLSTSAQGMRNI